MNMDLIYVDFLRINGSPVRRWYFNGLIVAILRERPNYYGTTKAGSTAFFKVG